MLKIYLRSQAYAFFLTSLDTYQSKDKYNTFLRRIKYKSQIKNYYRINYIKQ